MAITKTNALVESVMVRGDVITAKVNTALSESGVQLTTVRTNVLVSNATSGELTALQSLVTKAAALAVA